jgi:hypothetical protein
MDIQFKRLRQLPPGMVLATINADALTLFIFNPMNFAFANFINGRQ